MHNRSRIANKTFQFTSKVNNDNKLSCFLPLFWQKRWSSAMILAMGTNKNYLHYPQSFVKGSSIYNIHIKTRFLTTPPIVHMRPHEPEPHPLVDVTCGRHEIHITLLNPLVQ